MVRQIYYIAHHDAAQLVQPWTGIVASIERRLQELGTLASLRACVRAKTGYERLFLQAIERLQELGGVPVPVDFAAFAKTAGLLYTSAFLAERYSGVRGFLEAGPVSFRQAAKLGSLSPSRFCYFAHACICCSSP